MRELVREQRPVVGLLARAEDDVVADGVGACADRLCRVSGVRVGVNAHGGEIVAEPRLEIGAARRIERPAWHAQHVMHDPRRFADRRRRPLDALALQPFLLLAAGTFATEPERRQRGSGGRRRGHAHHPFGHPVRLPLPRVIDRAHDEFRLQGMRQRARRQVGCKDRAATEVPGGAAHLRRR